MQKGKLFIVSAPSGAGKTSLTKYVIQTLEKDFTIAKIITFTTRQPRPGEINGIDYNFVTISEFEQKKAAGAFLETTKYDGHFYGSPRTIIEDLNHGKSFFLVADRAGAKNIKSLIKDPVLIWLTIPNLHTLEERITNRGTESTNELNARLNLARKEIQDEERDPTFTYHLCNENFEKTAQAIITIIRKELGSTQNVAP